MSSLDEFEPTETWFNRFKNLLMNQDRAISPKMTSSNSSFTSPHRYFDFQQDFQVILEEKSIPNPNNNKENFPITPNAALKSHFSKEFVENKNLASLLPSKTIFNNSKTETLTANDAANDSFCFLENICNKSISDPNSTIHDYVEKLKEKQSFNNDSVENIEEEAMERLFKEFNVECDFKAKPDNDIDFADQTQLNDVEEPSALWETTVINENLQVSPTKMVGLLRPSTILEESISESDSSSRNESTQSFKTAQKTMETTNFETANNSFRSTALSRRINISDETYMSNLSTSDSLIKFDDSLDKNTLDDVSSLVFQEDSLIIKDEKKSIDQKMQDSCINISDDDDNVEDEECSSNDTLNSNNLNVSREFNDTMEEIGYILEKGMKSLKNTGGTPKIVQSATINRTATPAKLRVCITPSPVNSPKTPNTVISKPNASEKSSNLNNKRDLFKKPTNFGNTKIPQPKSVLNLKKANPYSNIVSPVGAYIKNTPQTPNIANIRENSVRSLDYGQFGKTALKKYTIDQLEENVSLEFTDGKSTCSLPKKAYESAKYRQVRDERTPLNIPGGQKIHKYLHNAFVPAVARHDGKLKMKPSIIPKDANDTVDTSLADLSVMSGNVSVYTIRDAQKF